MILAKSSELKQTWRPASPATSAGSPGWSTKLAPFLVVGTPGTLPYIRRLGFRTFTPLIDERYDSIFNDELRMQALFRAIDTLGDLNENQREALLDCAEPILVHNALHLRQLISPMAKLLSEIDARLHNL